MRYRVNHTIAWIGLTFAALCLIGGSQALGGTPSEPKILLEKADRCRKSLYGSREKMKYRHNWSNCIGLYETVSKRYPGRDEGAWALYWSGRMFTKLYMYSGMDKDLDRAVELYRTLAAGYEGHRLADDAQYRIGDIFYTYKKNPTQAYVEFLKVDIKFPSGDMRPKARSMMDKLTLILSKQDGGTKKVEEGLPSAPGLTKVKDIRHWSTPNYTRVVIDLERAVEYETHLLKADPDHSKPRRLYMDLKGAYVTSNIESTIPIRGGLLQRARAGQNKKDSVRVVLDIDSIGGHKVFHLHDPFRIVVDVQGIEKKEDAGKTVAAKKERPVRKGIRREERPDKTVSLARQLGLGVQRIVIDPGHGGRDPGCFLKGGIKEKDIVLQLAKDLAKKIESRLGCEAVLTRTGNVFLSLERRTAIANVSKADLFISLHINAHKQASVYGLETYFLNMATDAGAVMVAARENATSEKNISDLQTILNDLMLNTKISESSKLAHEVQQGMVSSIKKRYNRVKSLGVKQAPFYVLIGAEMPAVLVETGFITNPREKKRLLSKKYLEALSDGIVSGIAKYIKSIDQTFDGG
jgi:N-acetylmuramoyl-L-alanine amidase